MKTTALVLALAAVLLVAAARTSHADDDAGKILDLTYDDAPVREVLVEIARLGGKNIIVSPKVKGTVTIKLHGVPWRKALEIVAKTTGNVVVEEDDDIVRVVGGKKKPLVDAKQGHKRDTSKAPLIEGYVRSRTKPGGAFKLDGLVFRRDVDPEALVRLARQRIADLEAQLAKARVEKRRAEAGRLATELEAARSQVDRLRTRLGKQPQPKVSTRIITKEGQQQVLITLDEKGRVVARQVLEHEPETGFFFGKSDKAGRYRVAARALEEAAARKRIADLEAALKHLQAAGLHDEAKSVRERIAESKAALEQARREREEAERARNRLRTNLEYRTGTYATTTGPSLQSSIQALRKDVHALRGEVRELTGLVRQLLGKSKASWERPPPGSGSGGAGGGVRIR